MQNGLLQLFPMENRKFWQQVAGRQEEIQEIRLRSGKPIMVVRNGQEYFVDGNGYLTDKCESAQCIEARELEALLNHICHYSPYAFEEEIRQGFLTVAGGHRVGIAGQVVTDGRGGVRTIKHISYLNIRIAHQIKGVADKILPAIYDSGRVKNTLIISPPGCGKTTLLRDIIRQISDGNPYAGGISVGVVDERSEIAGSYLGMPQNDVGIRTDVLDACPKVLGMMLLLRSMAPGVIAIDEIGGGEDMEALRQAACCGSAVIATIHGEGLSDYIRKLGSALSVAENLFECVLILGKEMGQPIVRKICGKEEINAAFARRNDDSGRLPGNGAVVPEQFYGAFGGTAHFARHFGNADGRN